MCTLVVHNCFTLTLLYKLTNYERTHTDLSHFNTVVIGSASHAYTRTPRLWIYIRNT